MKQIELTRGKWAQVDDEDYIWLNKYKWSLSNQSYAIRSKKRKTLLMHRVITNCPPGKEIDHIDGNRLNNQRHNLRICNRSENQRNRREQRNNKSGKSGVNWHKGNKKWVVRIRVDKKCISLGCYKDLSKAIEVRNKAEIKYFGEFRFKENK